MSKILVSGLVNVETTCNINNFPINYQPIDYNFFGVNLNVAGVGFNLSSALSTLGDDVSLNTITGNDLASRIIAEKIKDIGVKANIQKIIEQTPLSVILYDKNGKRRIYCDLKDIQESTYDVSHMDLKQYDLVAVCNINFNRSLLHSAKSAGVKIATDVHVQYDVNDEYNREFMQYADILFLSNESVIGREEDFIKQLADTYNNEIIVMGCGSNGAIMYLREENRLIKQPPATPAKIVNTVGAGDALFSSFISMYAKGIKPEKCLELAQIFAAYKIGFDGASVGFLTFDELTANATDCL